MLGVGVAELPLGDARLLAQANRRALPHAEREGGERGSPEQVVVVGVRREQRADLEARLMEQRGQRVELVREVRRVDQHRLVAGTDRRAGGLPHPAGHDDGVRMDADGTHG